MLKRFIYLSYYLKKLDRTLFLKFLGYTSYKTGKSKVSLVMDCLKSVFLYNISLLEYFQFHFYDKLPAERRLWAGTGFMYESIKILNPKEEREILSNKHLFHTEYRKFIAHKYWHLRDLEEKGEMVMDAIRSIPSKKIVIKHTEGQCGRDIQVLGAQSLNLDGLKKLLYKTKNNMVEEFITQHQELNKLSPSGLNTLRIITIVNKVGEVDILGVRLRITINNHVDNLAAGNIAAPVELLSGIINGPGVYSDITKNSVAIHPVSGEKIEGFRIPFFAEAIKLVKKAAVHNTSNKSIGWDVAITDEGPSLLEGNHDWCKLVWQLPVHRGLKENLAKYV